MPTQPASGLFFNPFEKTPSPEKVEEEKGVELSQEKGTYVLDLSGLDLEEKGVEPSQEMGTYVLDLSGLDLPPTEKESFAHEIDEIEARFKVDYEGLSKLKLGEDGKMMELVSKGFIHKLMKSPPLPAPFPEFLGITDERLETVARGFRAMETARVIENDIIQQYRHSGYAYIELADD